MGCNYEIEVSPEQERQLISHYKNGRLRLLVQRKINVETREVKGATLESFEPITNTSFYDIADEIRMKYQELSFNEEINDSE